jgi:hypothetical protein
MKIPLKARKHNSFANGVLLCTKKIRENIMVTDMRTREPFFGDQIGKWGPNEDQKIMGLSFF